VQTYKKAYPVEDDELSSEASSDSASTTASSDTSQSSSPDPADVRPTIEPDDEDRKDPALFARSSEESSCDTGQATAVAPKGTSVSVVVAAKHEQALRPSMSTATRKRGKKEVLDSEDEDHSGVVPRKRSRPDHEDSATLSSFERPTWNAINNDASQNQMRSKDVSTCHY
jgi:hypothetical protein